MENDNVNHPIHYTSGGIECLDAIKASMSEEAFKGSLKGNCLKYLWKYEQKGGREGSCGDTIFDIYCEQFDAVIPDQTIKK